MVIVVAALLSLIALMLQPRQSMNVRIETMQSILKSVHVESTKKNAEELFKQYIVKSYVVNSEGGIIEDETAMKVDLKKEVAKIDRIKKDQAIIKERRTSPFKNFLAGFVQAKEIDRSSVEKEIAAVIGERKLPVYECRKDDEIYYVLPLRGKGLWGPIWGYLALEGDMNTVYGAVFDHKSETPGLGAEIKETWFQAPFQGKQIYEDGHFISIEVTKGGADPSDIHAVDAISGGTITSKGVQDMLFDCLSSYETFFANQRK
jgi:Na+-transporting NADH:ubiquinone oxidoreductase subunit C